MPAIFALADKLIEQPQTSIFAAFGSFALLVLVEFGGPWRTRFLAYLGLACVGAAFITLGSLCSRTPLLAAGAMALVGFATLFSGAFGGYFAAGATGALLTFVLPVTIPAPNSAIPDRLEGWDGPPDFARLDASRDAVAHALVRRLPELPTDTPAGSVPEALEAPFRIRAATYSARQVAGYALRATGADAPELDHRDLAQPPPSAALEATEQLAVEHASVRSVWFQNSIRGAAGLALAVYIAQRTGLQHGFWVVLGTLSVLRSNALGTGWSILSALAGTAVGIVLGALLVIGIGTHDAVLWGVLPIAVLLAAYAPRAISFAAGQAGFTVVLFVLFNIIQPVGWRVGLVRVEDVAIGFAISLGVGLLFSPRGAAALLREDLAAAYGRGADYVVATARQLIEGGDSEDAARAERAADGALHRLDDAFRQYLAERSATALNVEDVAALVGGASRIHRSAQSLTALGRMTDGKTLARCGENLDGELHALQSWYVTLGYALVNG